MIVPAMLKLKKQTNRDIQAHLIQSAFYLLMLAAMCSIPFALAERNAIKAEAPTKFFAKNTHVRGSRRLPARSRRSLLAA